jgi:hypothetical protein
MMKNNFYAIIFLLMPVWASGQLADDFNDGDFTANPAWSGNVTLWQVVSGTLNTNSSVASSTFYLSTPAATASNAEWRLYINLKFSTSSANYVDVYLASDSSDITANGNGYFVRIGGTTDEISLYRKDAGSVTKIIDGADGRSQVNSSDNKINLKVTRSAADSWTLWDDNSGTGLSYFQEGNIADATYATGDYFGIAVTQSTASFFNKHFFDDVYAGAIQVDTIPPAISSIAVISSTQADLLFNEPVEAVSAQSGTNYNVNNGIGNPSSAVLDGSNTALVHLTFTTAFTGGLSNTLTVTNVKDLANNAIISSSGNFTYIAPVTAAYRDVLISEIFADPSPVISLPDAEFVELFNASNKTFDLAGWTISDGTTTAAIPSHAFTPGEYVILCLNADTADFSVFGTVAGLSSFPSLNNAGDNMELKDNNLVLIDNVNYSDNWYHDDIKSDGGWSLELINPGIPSGCSDSANWTASNNAAGGTPGQQNSVYSTAPDTTAPVVMSVLATDSMHLTVCFDESILQNLLGNAGNYFVSGGIDTAVGAAPATGNSCVELSLGIPLLAGNPYTLYFFNLADCAGNPVQQATFNFSYYETSPADSGDVIINEVLFNAKPYGSDFVEIYNRSDKTIDLQTIHIAGADLATGALYSVGPFTTGKALLLPGEYAVVTEDAANIKLNYTVKDSLKLFEVADVPTFDDDEGIVVITGPAQNILDAFHYNKDLQFPLLKDVEGVSLERLSSERPSGDNTNWHSAAETAGYGTPTYKNSESAETSGYGTSFSVSPEIFSPDEDGYNDVVNILYHFDTPGYVANVTIFDARGRIVKKLVRNDLLGNDGTFSWDGINEDNNKAAIGIYVIYIELFDKDGNVKKYKKTCVLGSKL